MHFSAPASLRAVLKSSASFNWPTLAASGLLLAAPLMATTANANPLGPTVTSGAASISSPSSRQTNVDQTSEGVVIDWSSFNIGNGQTTTFVQPNAQAIAVNRIGGGNASQILGTLDANGRVVLINGNGVLFGKSSQVNVGSLVATSSGGSDSDLLAGKFTQTGSPNAAVVNQGRVTASQGGFVALVAPNVSNGGTVSAKLGTVTLGGANAFTVDLAGDGLVSFAAQGAGPAKVTNTGFLNGANISLTARAAEGLATGVVNVSGTITAQTARDVGGTIVLDGGDGGDVIVSNAKLDASGADGGGAIQIGGWNQNSVTVDKASVLNASATSAGNGGNISVVASGMSFQGVAFAQGGSQSGHGGTIETSGHVIDVGGARINTFASHGAMGMWTLDPENVTISSSATGNGTISSGVFTPSGDNSNLSAADLEAALGNTSVTVTTGNTGTQAGDITVLAPIAWSANTLTLDAYHSIFIDAAMTATSTAGLSLVTNDGGTGGGYFFNGGNVTFGNTSEALSINGNSYTLVDSVGGLASGISANASGYFALANNYDAAADGTYITAPVATTFSGTFEGLGNTISNLKIASSATGLSLGLFGDINTGGLVRDIALANIDVVDTGANTGNGRAGGLAGENDGTIEYASVGGIVDGTPEAGGLAGQNLGTISSSSADVTVTGLSSAGGLVGGNAGAISNSWAGGTVTGIGSVDAGGLAGFNSSGTIAQSYAIGAVLGGASSDVGGVLGANSGSGAVSYSYATGSATGGASSQVGGFVGNNGTSSTIDESYSKGAATGGAGSLVGGFAGKNTNTAGLGATIGDYYDSAVNAGAGVGSDAGTSNVTGLTSTQIVTESSFDRWTFGTSAGGAGWVIVDSDGTLNNAASATGATSPMLLTEYSTTITNAHQLQLIALNLSANYTLADNIDATATGNGTDVWGPGGFAALGGNNSNNFFSGDLNGEGHVINGLTVDNTTQSEAGLFGEFGGTVENLGLTNVDIETSKGVAANGNEPGLGALAGMSYGTITNVYATGSVTALQTDDNNTSAGGLVGFFDFGTISNSHTAVNVTAGAGSGVGGMAAYDFNGGVIENSYSTGIVTGGDNSIVGGLVGFILYAGTITDSFASGNAFGGNSADVGGLIGETFAGTISNSFATGNVSGNGNGEYGGFVGNNNGTITQSYATGTISKSGILTGGNFGGFAGGQDEYGTMAQVYSTGSVTADSTSTEGGFIGSNGGAINEVYSSGIVTGGQTGHVGGFAGMNAYAGVIGTTTEPYYETTGNGGLSGVGTNTGGSVTIGGIADMTNPANFTAWTDFGTHGSGQTWVTIGASGDINVSGGTTPMLLSEYSTSIFSAHQLQLMELEPNATYTVNNNINAGGTAGGDVWGSAGFIPVGGNDAPGFSGNFNGENYTISGLTINAPSLASIGLFGVSVGSIANVALTGVNITGGSYEAGALAAENDGAVTGSSASGSVTSPGTFVGGLVGSSNNTMSSDSADVAVTLTGFGNAGGLLGENSGAVSQSSASGAVTTTFVGAGEGDIVGGLVGQNDEGTIATSWSNGAVTGNSVLAGGLVGDNLNTGASISDSYSLGSVVVGANSYAGGLVGYNETSGQIARSYSASYVSGSGGSSVGGFVGTDISTNGITNSYFDIESSGAAASAGAGNVANDSGITGKTGAQLMGALPSGFSNTTWGTGSGLLPYLPWQFPSGAPQAISGTVTNGGSAVVGLNVNGVSVDGTAATSALAMNSGANGFYYLLFAPGTIANGSDVLTYASGSGATLSENATGSLTGVNLVANTLLEPTSDTDYATLASNLDTAIAGNGAAQAFIGGLSVQEIQISASNFAIDQTIGATTLVLTSSGTVTQSAGITATNLELLNGAFQLSGNSNQVGTLAADAGSLSLADSGSLVVGSVNGLNGVTVAGALSLTSTNTITQTAAIDAASLSGSSIGGTTLNGPNEIGDLGAFTNLSTGGFALTDDETLTVNGAVGSGSGTLALTTVGAGHNILVDQTVTSGSTVDLVASGEIGESGSGLITAPMLTGSSSGGTSLSSANLITDLEAFSNTGTGGLSVTNAKALTVTGAVNSGSGALTLTTTGAGHSITVDDALTATTTVDLASAGTITQSTAGIVTAVELTGTSAGGTTLTKANLVSDLGAFTNTGSGGITLTDGKALVVLGVVNAGTGNFAITTTGAGSNISLDKAITAGATVDLISAGTIGQTNVGIITAATLVGSSVGGATLSKANVVGDLGAFTNTGAGGFALEDTSLLTVNGPVSAGTGNLTLTTTGTGNNIVISKAINAGGTVDLVSTGSISQANTGIITAGTLIGSDTVTTTLKAANEISNLGAFTDTGGNLAFTDDENLAITGLVKDGAHTVTLTGTGTLSESGGAIDANALDGSSAGGATFSGSNLISDLYGFTNSGAGGLTLNDGEKLTVGNTVAAGTGNLSLTTGAGNLVITKAISAGGSVDLVSAASISQATAGIITAGTLTGSAGGTTVLNSANLITNLGAFTNTGGNFELTNAQGLTVAGTVNSGTRTLTLQTSTGDLDVNAALDGKTVTLGSTQGEVIGTGAITAHLINVTANTGIDLTGANDIAVLGTDQTNSGPNVIDGVQ
jgi:filamentous hemagglutinin family protein